MSPEWMMSRFQHRSFFLPCAVTNDLTHVHTPIARSQDRASYLFDVLQ